MRRNAVVAVVVAVAVAVAEVTTALESRATDPLRATTEPDPPSPRPRPVVRGRPHAQNGHPPLTRRTPLRHNGNGNRSANSHQTRLSPACSRELQADAAGPGTGRRRRTRSARTPTTPPAARPRHRQPRRAASPSASTVPGPPSPAPNAPAAARCPALAELPAEGAERPSATRPPGRATGLPLPARRHPLPRVLSWSAPDPAPTSRATCHCTSYEGRTSGPVRVTRAARPVEDIRTCSACAKPRCPARPPSAYRRRAVRPPDRSGPCPSTPTGPSSPDPACPNSPSTASASSAGRSHVRLTGRSNGRCRRRPHQGTDQGRRRVPPGQAPR